MGQKYDIRSDHIISFEMEIKLQYKDCDITIKKNDKIYIIDCAIISKVGYIVKISETFLSKQRIYSKLVDYLNNVIDNDLEVVYQRLLNKRNFVDKLK